MSSTLAEIEERLSVLSYEERLTLIERLVRTLREAPEPERTSWDAALAAMAVDPEIQREMSQIDSEFAQTLGDGLGRY
jgi:hypothetical protein